MTPVIETDRDQQLGRLRNGRAWDLIVVGGGATGLGVALDAAARGLAVLCLERDDFAKGTSSRATKLVHGGVRYLAQGNVSLVREALHERATLLANAPHLAQPLPFVVPGYRWWEPPFYGVGLKLYAALAGRRSLGATEWLSARQTREVLPTVRAQGLSGGIQYWDAQFDDARLAVTLARTAIGLGAVVLNHVPVDGLVRQQGKVAGVLAHDAETGERFELRAACVVNATGVWVDALRDMDQDEGAAQRAPMVAPSQGTHIVVDRSFLPGQHALMVPHTRDGRVLFVVPWLGHTILGTTDTPRNDLAAEPEPFRADVDFILGEAGRYLERTPTRADIRSIWVGLRPLVRAPDDDAGPTRKLSREHTVRVGRSGLVTVTGGKWTTYRAMAEDVLEHCMDAGLLPRSAAGRTEHLPLAGAATTGHALCEPTGEHLYGSELALMRSAPGAEHWLWRDSAGALSEAMVRHAVRHELARRVEDVLARRCRLLFLDAARAEALAPVVAELIAEELGRPVRVGEVEAFTALAQRYRTVP
jgi:glycerol-3-phosphate dehydrogenase